MKQVAVAPNSLLTGSPEPVFRNKTHGDVKTGSKKKTKTEQRRNEAGKNNIIT